MQPKVLTPKVVLNKGYCIGYRTISIYIIHIYYYGMSNITCKVLPGRGRLVFLSTFLLVYSGSELGGELTSSAESAAGFKFCRVPSSVTGKIRVVGTCSVTVNRGSFVALKFVIMLECSFCKIKEIFKIRISLLPKTQQQQYCSIIYYLITYFVSLHIFCMQYFTNYII